MTAMSNKSGGRPAKSRPGRERVPGDEAGSVDWPRMVRRFDHPAARALVLVGSHARGDPNAFSDVDLVRFTSSDAPSLPGAGVHLEGGHLVAVSDCPPDEVESWFARPELALSRIPGLRSGRALRDGGGHFAALRARAAAFAWDATMQARADAFATEAMVGWVEEVHKGLAGLSGAVGRGGTTGRLLDAEFGLSWGLNRLVLVQRGVPLAPPPDGGWSRDWFAQGEQAAGSESEWARLRRLAFGVASAADVTGAPARAPRTLEQRVAAGLRFYVATAELLADAWRPPGAGLIAHAVDLVRAALPTR